MRILLPLLAFICLTTNRAQAQGIVAFVQDDCPACRAAEPTLAQLQATGTRVVRYRASGLDPVCRTLGITLTPTLIAVDRHGREVQRLVGRVQPAAIEALARRATDAP